MHKSARWFQPRFTELLVVLLAIAAGAFSSAALAQAAIAKLEWLTWSFFRFTSPGGKVILTNPFITGNPDAASGVKVEETTKADLILIPNGHRNGRFIWEGITIRITIASRPRPGRRPSRTPEKCSIRWAYGFQSLRWRPNRPSSCPSLPVAR